MAKKKARWRLAWQLKAEAGLVLLSLLIYAVHLLLFRDLHHILVFGVSELAFVPIEVLFVTLILHKFLEEREKAARLRKMNMFIGVFFSEVGTGLLRYLRAFECRHSPTEQIIINLRRNDAVDLLHLATTMKNEDFEVENPNLLEHESFTELLWAVFHMAEEFASRPSIPLSSGPDQKHLLGDMNRSYHLLAREWLKYLGHLKADYPYLYSQAVRLNPFDPMASAEVKA